MEGGGGASHFSAAYSVGMKRHKRHSGEVVICFYFHLEFQLEVQKISGLRHVLCIAFCCFLRQET